MSDGSGNGAEERPAAPPAPGPPPGWTTSPPPPGAPPPVPPGTPPAASGWGVGPPDGGAEQAGRLSPPTQWGAQPPPPPPYAGQYPGGWQGSPYGQAPYGVYAAPPRTNRLAIASFVGSLCFIVPFVGFLAPLFAVISGFISRNQVQRSGGTQKGAGFALAGIIIGFVMLAIEIVGVILVIRGLHCDSVKGHLSCRL